MAITISGSGITSANIADGAITADDIAPGAVEGVPSGCILMWSGASSAIPSGWNLCDGNNGTPNLVGKFIKAASTAGATGGSTSTGAHTLSIAEMPSHNHSYTATAAPGGFQHGNYSYVHVPSAASTGSTGGGGSHSHTAEPPYFELCYIMKA